MTAGALAVLVAGFAGGVAGVAIVLFRGTREPAWAGVLAKTLIVVCAGTIVGAVRAAKYHGGYGTISAAELAHRGWKWMIVAGVFIAIAWRDRRDAPGPREAHPAPNRMMRFRRR
jgi:hypothetical protein